MGRKESNQTKTNKHSDGIPEIILKKNQQMTKKHEKLSQGGKKLKLSSCKF